MDMDKRVCSRARLARDARFDGKFFIGVLTTRIYCRPICRSRTSHEKNVRYFASAAEATEAGFRPCLRCRPECSPGTPAWSGTKSTVSRALRLISETGLDSEGLEGLAGQLGVGTRHLRRLFLQHLGASPSAVAHTQRLQFAKKLIDETSLSMTQISLAAGFGSVRRFNAAIHDVYHRTPTQIRALSGKRDAQPENTYVFQVGFRPPYDFARMLAFFEEWVTPGVEQVAGGKYRRTISLHGSHGCLEVVPIEGQPALSIRMQIGTPQALFFAIERVRSVFDLDADWPTIARSLGADPVLASKIHSNPGLRVPGCWEGFELAVRAILSDPIGAEYGKPFAAQLVDSFGQRVSYGDGLTHLFPTAKVLADANLRNAGLGLTAAQARTIRSLAQAVRSNHLSFEKILDTEDFMKRLSALPGIGNWTAQYIALRVLREPDAFPSADRKLVRAMRLRSSADLEHRSHLWRPWRAYAAIYLSSHTDGGTRARKQ